MPTDDRALHRVPRARRVTIADVARRAGVSKSAVSHVFNDRGDISAAVQERIRTAAADLGWRPAAAARALAGARTRTIGYVVRRNAHQLRTDPFFGEVIAGVQPVLTEHLSTLLVSVVSTPDEELAVYRRLVEAHQVDGFFLIDHRQHDPRYKLIMDAGLPAVAIGQPRPDMTFPSVTPSPNVLAEAVGMLAAHGHRQLAYVSDPREFTHSDIRRQQIQKAARALSLPRVRTRTAARTPQSAADATNALLATTPRPTAILYADDWLAMWGMDAIQASGLRIPRDVSVIGYDDVPPAARARPALTTVHVDVAELAGTAATMLLDLLAGRPVQPAHTAAHLVVRESTGTAPG
jgi:DNA-binding LacI/PurR family transcriptional regulator